VPEDLAPRRIPPAPTRDDGDEALEEVAARGDKLGLELPAAFRIEGQREIRGHLEIVLDDSGAWTHTSDPPGDHDRSEVGERVDDKRLQGGCRSPEAASSAPPRTASLTSFTSSYWARARTRESPRRRKADRRSRPAGAPRCPSSGLRRTGVRRGSRGSDRVLRRRARTCGSLRSRSSIRFASTVSCGPYVHDVDFVFLAEAMDPPDPLLDPKWIPRKIVIHDGPRKLKVPALASRFGAQEDVGSPRNVRTAASFATGERPHGRPRRDGLRPRGPPGVLKRPKILSEDQDLLVDGLEEFAEPPGLHVRCDRRGILPQVLETLPFVRPEERALGEASERLCHANVLLPISRCRTIKVNRAVQGNRPDADQ